VDADEGIHTSSRDKYGIARDDPAQCGSHGCEDRYAAEHKGIDEYDPEGSHTAAIRQPSHPDRYADPERVARVHGVRIHRTMGGMSEANDSKVKLDEPEHVEYSDEHAWMDSSVEPAMVGVTEYATGQLDELVHIDLPEDGTQVEADDEVAEFESSKPVTAQV
jgi:Glycine cleavage system H protein (lipoate-binding)